MATKKAARLNQRPRIKKGKPVADYSPDRPAGREPPGTGQPGDELGLPEELESGRDIAEAAVEAGKTAPPAEAPVEEAVPDEAVMQHPSPVVLPTAEQSARKEPE